MKKIINSTLYDYLLNAAFLIIVIAFGVVFHSSPLIILTNILSISSMLFITKGSFVGTILQILCAILYAIVSFISAYYGEVICSVALTIPITFISIITWVRNRNKGTTIVKVNKIKLTEWVIMFATSIIAFVGVYWLLKSFNTANLVISAISLTLGIYANYLLMRRCEFNFIIYIINNIVCIALWMFMVVKDISYLPLVVNYCMLLIYNIIGFANWIKLKKTQNK